MDLFQYCTESKEGYVMLLATLNAGLIAARANWIEVDDQPIFFVKVKRVMASRFLKKSGLSYWLDPVSNEQ